jgi:hypothetical protein
MNFLSCDGDWLLYETGSFACDGTLISVSEQEITGSDASLSWGDVSELTGEVIILFATVFCFVALRRVLK